MFICGNFNSSRDVLEVDKMRFLSERKNNLPIKMELGSKLWSNYRGFINSG